MFLWAGGQCVWAIAQLSSLPTFPISFENKTQTKASVVVGEERKRGPHMSFPMFSALFPPSYFALQPAGGKGVRPRARKEKEGPLDLVSEVVDAEDVERRKEMRSQEALKVYPWGGGGGDRLLAGGWESAHHTTRA